MDVDGNVVSFINMKGGVGKTTLCKEIGYTLANRFEKKVLFVDIDPQSNLTQSLFERFSYVSKEGIKDLSKSEKKGLTVCDKSINSLFQANANSMVPEPEDVIQNLEKNKISLIPGDLSTVFLERSNGGAARENALDNYIVDKQLTSTYDYILIDCPPTYSFYTTAALKASQYYLVPVGIDPYSVLGIDLLKQVVKDLEKTDVRRFRDKPLIDLGIIFNPISKGVQTNNQLGRQKTKIRQSKRLSKYNLHYFEEDFNFNFKFRDEVGYFVLDSQNKKSRSNIISITEEFLSQVENNGK
ncbi:MULTISPECIES: ParA family protein [Levilactobacillus]|uniref:ParA family protein n=1 Tax=Levilactobacillus TaxID=2767886 RepID=UPI003757242A